MTALRRTCLIDLSRSRPPRGVQVRRGPWPTTCLGGVSINESTRTCDKHGEFRMGKGCPECRRARDREYSRKTLDKRREYERGLRERRRQEPRLKDCSTPECQNKAAHGRRVCNSCKSAKHYAKNPEYYQSWHRARRARMTPEERSRELRKSQEWRARPEVRERLRRYYSEYRRAYMYGVSAAEFQRMLEASGGLCGICRNPFSSPKTTHVDHDHETGVVRGLLCVKCNNGLGQFGDDPDLLEAAIAYLKSHLDRPAHRRVST